MFRTGFRTVDFSPARLGALGLAAVLALGGCSKSGDPGADAAGGRSSSAVPSSSASPGSGASESTSPSFAPTSTPTSPSFAPTSTPTAVYKPATAEGPAENVPLPVMPVLATQESKEGLEAFVRYWFALVNYGYETGEVEPVRTRSGASCHHCDGYYAAIDKGYRGHDWIVGGTLVLRGVGTEFIKSPEGRYQVVVSVEEVPSTYLGTEGAVYGEKPGSEYLFAQIIETSYMDGSWTVELVDNLG